MHKQLKNKLVAGIIWTAVKQGGFQRSRIYKKDATISSKQKRQLQNHIKEFCYAHLFKLNENERLTEPQLLNLIRQLSSEIQSNFQPILNNGTFQFGNAQKFINLYLKLLWVTDRIQEPQHFPVDRLIQKGFSNILPWTDMNEDQYMEVINRAKVQAKTKNLSIAQWEAEEYDRITSSAR